MLTISHVLIGGAVGVATANPITAFVAGVASHFVADMVPHLDVPPNSRYNSAGDIIFTKQIYAIAITDVVVSGLLVLYLWKTYFNFPDLHPFVLGAVGGFFPDFLDNVPFWNNKLRPVPFRQTIKRYAFRINY